MRVEQRIGRVHRLGQEKEVLVFNLSVAQTIEARILELLSNKIRMFELVIGELDIILGDIEEERSFEQKLIDIFLRSRTDADAARKFEHFGDELSKARRKFDKIKEHQEVLSDLVDV